jgi:very-short-patch-repair endonuclease
LRRDAYLNRFGFTVLHVTNHDVMSNMDRALQVILRTLKSADRPHPNPTPQGEGL